MASDNTLGGMEADRCAVCEKSVVGGKGYAHIKHDNQLVTLCCPLCLETFQKKPAYYIALRAGRNIKRPEQERQ